MLSHSQILHLASRLASINKGKSLNDRDANCRINFKHGYCEVVSGGLFAICCLRLPVECNEPFSVELNTSTLQGIASELCDMECEITGVDSKVRFSFGNSYVDAVNRTLWDHFAFNANFDRPCVITKDIAQAIFQSVPKLLSDDGEKATMAAMQLQAANDSLSCSSTDKRMAVKIVVPCQGELKPILLPFAAVPVLRWAVAEFGETDDLRIALDGEQLAIKCGPFECVVKQPSLRVPNVDAALDRFRTLLTSSVDIPVGNLSFAASQANSLGYESCRLELGDKSSLRAGEEKKDNFSVAIDVISAVPGSLKANPNYFVTALSCMSKLKFDSMNCRFSETPRNPFLMTSSNGNVSVEVAIAQME